MKKKDLKIIREIQARAWAKFGDKLFRDVDKAPIMTKLLETASKDVDDPTLTDEERDIVKEMSDADREKYRAMRQSGILEGTRKEEDPEVAKEYEAYVQKCIEQEINKGNLTKPDPKKVKQYERRQKHIGKSN